MILAKKVRLIPTPEQEKVLRNHAGAARFAYNYCKRMSDRYYKLFGKSVSQLALQKRFTRSRSERDMSGYMTLTHKFPNRLQKILIRREKIRSKSIKMVITLLINPKKI